MIKNTSLIALSAILNTETLYAGSSSSYHSSLYHLAEKSLPKFQPQTKNQYHLLNPTPHSQMRDLSPDRPDVTESAQTVDAGHFAIEVSLFDWRRNDGDQGYTALSSNMKVGLTNNTDLQFVFDAYSWDDPKSGAQREGFGDVQLRLKYNLWGNDSGNTALALFPFVKVPTGAALSNNEWEGGVIVPFSYQVNDSLSLGLMGELDFVYNDVEQDHEIQFLHTAVLGLGLTEQLGFYSEYIGITGDMPYEAYLAGGFAYSVNEDLILDLGAQFGINTAADRLGVFSGFTQRF